MGSRGDGGATREHPGIRASGSTRGGRAPAADPGNRARPIDPGARPSGVDPAADRDRGRHTVLLGMAPGVGKTYRALQDLRRARDAGRDAVVAVVETHGRADTALQIEGLEVLPRRTLEHRGIVQQRKKRQLDVGTPTRLGRRRTINSDEPASGINPCGNRRSFGPLQIASDDHAACLR